MLAKLISSQRLQWLTCATALSVGAVLGFSLLTDFVDRAEKNVQDKLMGWTSVETDPDLVLLALDEESMTLSGVEPAEIADSRALQLMKKGYPWSREVYALLAGKVLAAGAKVIVFDLVFPSPREGDEAFAETIKKDGSKLVLASNFDESAAEQAGGMSSYITPTSALAQNASGRVGFVNLAESPDNVVREFYPYQNAYSFDGGGFGDDPVLPAISTLAAQTLGFAPAQPEQPRKLRLRYLKKESIPLYSLYTIFVPAYWHANLKDGKVFEGKTVLVGATAARLQDYHMTPLGRLSGPEIQLNFISAMKRHAWITEVPAIWTLLSVPFAGLIIFLLAMFRKNIMLFILGSLGVGVAWMGIFCLSYLVLHAYLPLVHPLATIILCSLAISLADVSLERKERSRLRGTLERYVSKDIVREIVDNSDSYLQNLGGQRKKITVLFCDLKGFTSAVETMEASEVVRLLNEYFGEMVEAVFAQRGTMDKFIGDALMATWGGLQESALDEDARQSVLAALEMKKRRLALNARRAEAGIDVWDAGIGLAQGLAVFGNIGSQEKMDPTVIGDAVNLASRIEGLTRMYGCDILIDERVAAQARDICPMLLVDVVRVKGRRAHETLFFPYEAIDQPWIDAFNEARKAYIEEHFAEAAGLFTALIASGPAPGLAECYRQRCDAFLRKPPHENWDGVWEFLEK